MAGNSVNPLMCNPGVAVIHRARKYVRDRGLTMNAWLSALVKRELSVAVHEDMHKPTRPVDIVPSLDPAKRLEDRHTKEREYEDTGIRSPFLTKPERKAQRQAVAVRPSFRD